jgi:hypothetical protein
MLVSDLLILQMTSIMAQGPLSVLAQQMFGLIELCVFG